MTAAAAVNYYHKELHLGCCSSPRSASDNSNDFHFVRNNIGLLKSSLLGNHMDYEIRSKLEIGNSFTSVKEVKI